MLMVSCTSFLGERQEPPLLVGRGERMIVLRGPFSGNNELMDVTFYNNNPALNTPRLIDIIPVNYYSLKEYMITEAQLNESDWNKAEQIRSQWCDHRESRPEEANNGEVMTIGITCGNAIVVFSTSVTNQSKDLQELTQLIPEKTNENTYTVPNIAYP